MTEEIEHRNWSDGFKQGYAKFIIRPGSDPSYTAGYHAGRDLRHVHQHDFERVLLAGRHDGRMASPS
jgi:hypothetical protein